MKNPRLNRRLAPELYLEVLPITGSVEAPRLDGGGGQVIDWAVVMRRFDPDAILSNLAAQLTPPLMERLAHCVAGFHAGAAVSPTRRPMAALRSHGADAGQFDQISALAGSPHCHLPGCGPGHRSSTHA